MRELALTAIAIGAVAVLIPWPGLIWISLALLALLWIATPIWGRANVEPGAEDPGELREEREL